MHSTSHSSRRSIINLRKWVFVYCLGRITCLLDSSAAALSSLRLVHVIIIKDVVSSLVCSKTIGLRRAIMRRTSQCLQPSNKDSFSALIALISHRLLLYLQDSVSQTKERPLTANHAMINQRRSPTQSTSMQHHSGNCCYGRRGNTARGAGIPSQIHCSSPINHAGT